MPKCLMELEPSVTVLDFVVSRVEEVKPSRIIIVTRPEFRRALEERLGGGRKLLKPILKSLETFTVSA
ncbi:MAG: hypothetical protein ACUVUS_09915, partial [Thermoproteota archaeon]